MCYFTRKLKIVSNILFMIVGLAIDTKLTFKENFENKINKCNRIIGSVRSLSLMAPTKCLLTVHKAFQKQPPRGVLIKRCSENMQQIYRRTLMLKYDFNKVGRRWYRKMTFFHKISKNLAPKYLRSYLLPIALNQYLTRSAKDKITGSFTFKNTII